MLTEGQIFIGGEDLGAKINKQGEGRIIIRDFHIDDMKKLTGEDFRFLSNFFAQFPVEPPLEELKGKNVLRRREKPIKLADLLYIESLNPGTIS